MVDDSIWCYQWHVSNHVIMSSLVATICHVLSSAENHSQGLFKHYSVEYFTLYNCDTLRTCLYENLFLHLPVQVQILPVKCISTYFMNGVWYWVAAVAIRLSVWLIRTPASCSCVSCEDWWIREILHLHIAPSSPSSQSSPQICYKLRNIEQLQDLKIYFVREHVA